MTTDRLTRWRLLLGKTAEDDLRGMPGCSGAGKPMLTGELSELDEALEMIYPCNEGEGQSQEMSREEWEASTSGRKHASAKGRSLPRVARWLHEIRRFFPTDVVALLQKDAIERRGL